MKILRTALLRALPICLPSLIGVVTPTTLFAVSPGQQEIAPVGVDLSTPEGKKALARQLKLAVKAGCRSLSVEALGQHPFGPGNGHAGFAPSPSESPRAKCEREGMREARRRGDALIADSLGD